MTQNQIKRIVARILGIVVLLFLLYQFLPLADRIIIGRQLAQEAVPFSQYVSNPELTVLVIGDSSALGTGANASSDSVSGRLAQDYSHSSISNLAVNGAITKEVLEQLNSIGGNFDLIIINTGGNDLIHFTPLDEVRRSMEMLIEEAIQRSKVVVLFTTGNAAKSPFLPNSLAKIYGKRSVEIRNIALELANNSDIIYVDLIGYELALGQDDPYGKDFFSADGLHPSSQGYKTLYEWMLKELEENEVDLNNL